MKNIRNAIIYGLTALTSAVLPMKADALDGFVKYAHPIEDPQKSYIEPNTFYNLPGDVNGSTWLELFQNGEGYFGETNLEREVTNGFNVNTQIQHCNALANRVGVGVSRQVPTPEGTYLKISAFPIWFDEEGRQENTVEMAYFGEVQLPYGFSANSFGDWNLASEDGVQWDYGEVDLGREVAKGIRLSYNPALLNDGGAVPEVEHRVSASVNF